MLNYRVLAALSVAALLAVGFSVSTKTEPTLTERIDNANTDLMTVQAPIPHVQLHARALEILRSITVAKDDEVTADAAARAAAEACVAFEKSPMDQVTCK